MGREETLRLTAGLNRIINNYFIFCDLQILKQALAGKGPVHGQERKAIKF